MNTFRNKHHVTKTNVQTKFHQFFAATLITGPNKHLPKPYLSE